jgi:acid phosphatase
MSRVSRSRSLFAALVTALVANGCLAQTLPSPPPARVVVLIEENHALNEIRGSAQAPFLNALATYGTTMTQSYATGHPSQPNYLELFSGSNQGVSSDACPAVPTDLTTPNLATALASVGRTFAGYAESLPSTGSLQCSTGAYARKHNPWSSFAQVAPTSNRPFSQFPTSNFAALPTVSFVVPNLDDDMHDGSIAQADAWAKAHLSGYVAWAQTHNSLLIVTFDEDDGSAGNHILTFFVGPMVKPGVSAQRITHDDLLRTLEGLYGAKPTGNSVNAHPVVGIWK